MPDELLQIRMTGFSWSKQNVLTSPSELADLQEESELRLWSEDHEQLTSSSAASSTNRPVTEQLLTQPRVLHRMLKTAEGLTEQPGLTGRGQSTGSGLFGLVFFSAALRRLICASCRVVCFPAHAATRFLFPADGADTVCFVNLSSEML